VTFRPVGVDGDVGTIVVEDGAGTVEDFLVALNLRHNLLIVPPLAARGFRGLPPLSFAWTVVVNHSPNKKYRKIVSRHINNQIAVVLSLALSP